MQIESGAGNPHEKDAQRVEVFTCDKCHQEFSTEGSLKNHLKHCGGQQAERPGMARCECGKEVLKCNIARHRRSCTVLRNIREAVNRCQQDQQRPRVYVATRKACDRCGRMLSAANMARHQRSCVGRV